MDEEDLQGLGVASSSRVETIKQLVHIAGFSKEIAEVVMSNLRSAACLYWGKWSRLLHWYHGQNIALCKATVLPIGFFLYLNQELELSVPAIKGYSL